MRPLRAVVARRDGTTVLSLLRIFFFFFQAEDGIRDLIVTGVQTCALPIYEDFELKPTSSAIARIDKCFLAGSSNLLLASSTRCVLMKSRIFWLSCSLTTWERC